MTIKCPQCHGIIETSEYTHPCRPQPRESLTHRLMMATVARHKKHNDELQLAKAAYTVMRKFNPPFGDPALRRAVAHLKRVSLEALVEAEKSTRSVTKHSRRWNDNRPIDHHPV